MDCAVDYVERDQIILLLEDLVKELDYDTYKELFITDIDTHQIDRLVKLVQYHLEEWSDF